MPLTQQQKDNVKKDWDQLTALAGKFARGSNQDLYVVDGKPLLKGGEALARLLARIPKAAHTRGKQGHGRT